jgi:hypothetical protein
MESDTKQKRGRPRKSDKELSSSGGCGDEIASASVKKYRNAPSCVGTFSIAGNGNIKLAGTGNLSAPISSKQTNAIIDTIEKKNIPRQYIIKLIIGLKDIQSINTNETMPMNTYNSLIKNMELPYSEQTMSINNLYPAKIMAICPSTLPKCLFESVQNANPKSKVIANDINEIATSMQLKIDQEINSRCVNGDILCKLIYNQFGNNSPQSSPYPCLYCDKTFTGCPIGIPKYEYNGIIYCSDEYHCDFPCAARHMYETMSIEEFYAAYSLLCNMNQKVYNLPPDEQVIMMPPKKSWDSYGGCLTTDDREKLIKNKDISIELYQLPLIPSYLHICQINNNLSINSIVESNTKKHQRDGQQNAKKTAMPVDLEDIKKAKLNVKALLESKQDHNSHFFKH